MASGIPIGPYMLQLASTGTALYGIRALDDAVCRYDDVPNQWTWLAGTPDPAQIACNDTDLFVLTKTGQVLQYAGEPQSWFSIGIGKQAIAAAGDQLYAIDSDSQSVSRYVGWPMAWTRIGPPASSLSTNGPNLLMISQDQSESLMYCEEPPSWKQIGSDLTQICLASNAAYAVASDGVTLMRYSVEDGAWTNVGTDWGTFVPCGSSLYAISTDGSQVGEFQGTPGTWIPFATTTNASVIATDHQALYVGDRDSVQQYPLDSLQSPGPAITDRWIWSFSTADQWLAGYDGQVFITLHWDDAHPQGFEPPLTSFERGRTSFCHLKVKRVPSSPTSLSVKGEGNFLGDQWNLATVTAWDPVTNTLYTFTFNQKVPNSGSISAEPVATQMTTPLDGIATVYVWDYLGLDESVGHASLSLSDGTYISWWPSETVMLDMASLWAGFVKPAAKNRTYEQDVSAENKDPDWVIPVGGLEVQAIAQWWAEFQATHPDWALLAQNCSTTVADALFAGGATRILTGGEYESVVPELMPWTPNRVLTMAQFLASHYTPTKDTKVNEDLRTDAAYADEAAVLS